MAGKIIYLFWIFWSIFAEVVHFKGKTLLELNISINCETD